MLATVFRTPILVTTSALCGLLLAGCGPKGPLYEARTDAGAPVWERTAALELTNYVSRVVTNRFTVGGEAGVVFHVGDTAFARQHGIAAKDLKDDEWRVRSFGRDVVLVGGGTRGTIYAVSHFLEDSLDVHWWSATEEHVPAAKPVDLPALDYGGTPAFLHRYIYEAVAADGRKATAAEAAFATNVSRIGILNRLNGSRRELPDYGGSVRWGSPSFVHTFDSYVPWKTFQKTHPEYFSLVNGKRVGGVTGGQLCVTNPDLVDVFYGKLLAFIDGDAKKAQASGLPAPRLYDISMNDTQNACGCDRCKAETKKYGHSGVYLKYLLNPLAKRIAAVHPEILLTTLAYHYTEPVPTGGVRAEDNIVIRLCDTHTSMAGSPSEKGNTGFRDNLVAWNKVAKNLMIWDYSICYTFSEGLPNGVSFPCASERHYPELYRMFRDTGVQGVFVEHEMNGFSDFHELKYFLQCKLAENPDADAEALTDLFMSRYYGAAGGLLADYRRDLERIRKERHGYVTWEPGLAPFNFIRDEDMARYQAMFEKAENLVKDDPTRLARVRHARTGLDTLLVHRAKVQVVYHGPAKPTPDASAALRRIRADIPAWMACHGKAMGPLDAKRFMIVTNDLPKTAPRSLKPPKEFADRRFYDFYAWDLTGKLVDDPESLVGQARRIDATVDPNNYYGLPFVVGYFNLTGIGLSGVKGLDKPAGKGYHWYKFQVGLMPPSEWIYMTRGWHISLRKGLSRLAGETLETWVSIKFEGPRYYPDDPSEKDRPSAISVDRVIFAEPN